MRTIHELLAQIRAEYLEMPGMQLTASQVERLCGIEGTVCQAVLDALVDATFLYVKTNGAYARVTDARVSPQRALKVDLRRKQDVQRAS